MKHYRYFAVLVVLLVFVGTFFLVQSGITGYVTDGLQLKVVSISSGDTSATIHWKTSAPTVSTINVNNENIAYPTATEFTKEIANLEQGKTYEYNIRACDQDLCEEKAGTFSTRGGETFFTGAIVAVQDRAESIRSLHVIPENLKAGASLVFYALIGMVIAVVAGRVGYEKLFNNDPMDELIKQSKDAVEAQEWQTAHILYTQAREAFAQLEAEAKVQHYDDLMNIYGSLKRHFDIQEAQELAEKYSQGTISKEEMGRLNELLSQ